MNTAGAVCAEVGAVAEKTVVARCVVGLRDAAAGTVADIVGADIAVARALGTRRGETCVRGLIADVPALRACCARIAFVETTGAVRADVGAVAEKTVVARCVVCLLYTSPSPRDVEESRMPSSA